MKLSKSDIIKSYNYCKEQASKAIKNRQYNKSLKYIKIASHIAYNFNWIYCDDYLENLLKDISSLKLKPTVNYKSNKTNSIVFYDSFTLDNKGLTQQYIRALISNGIEFLYITESSRLNKKSLNIFKELETYDKVQIYEVPRNIKKTEKIKLIHSKIISYGSSMLLMHLSPNAVNALTAFYALPKNITKFQINITDHAFWLGNKCLDYSIEFRAYGCTLSKEKRGLKEKQILLQPYYPIISKSDFLGFPKECTNKKIIIFSGGSYYKIYGDNGEYFNLVKQILLENQEVIFLFAGAGDKSPIENFIKSNAFENRFFLLGLRPDINEVFKQCDIYMGTYPLGGGLMSQYAAINSKPILNYITDTNGFAVEEVVCQNNDCSISFNEKEKFFLEAKRLVNDVNYRNQKGKEIKKCVISEEKFDNAFLNIIKYRINQKKYQDVKIEYDNIFHKYLETENKFHNNYKLYLISNFKLKTILISPKIFIWFVFFFLSKKGFLKIKKWFDLRFNTRFGNTRL